MTDIERHDLEVLNQRMDQTAALAMIVATHANVANESADALRGIAETITELAMRMDCIVNPRPGERAA